MSFTRYALAFLVVFSFLLMIGCQAVPPVDTGVELDDKATDGFVSLFNGKVIIPYGFCDGRT